ATRAASVLDCQDKIGGDMSKGAAILVNSGNANAFTGAAGKASVARICASVAARLNIPAEAVFTSSTGVIGEVLPDQRITDCLDQLTAFLNPAAQEEAARAIMTTDTFPKGASKLLEIDGQPVTISGFAKGSGMIAPDMATMLVYIFTDAKISQPDLQALLGDLTNQTFNCITVDSDTSTSDALICAATGASGVDVTDSREFAEALKEVMLDLAHQVVKDGEGATKFVTVEVTGAKNDADARKVAISIANSPLVKTAIAGEDPNWGRIVMAVGKSGAEADRDRLSIWFGPHLVAENGWVAPSYTEEAGASYMQQAELIIRTDLGVGTAQTTVWTCDLTHGYIEINADYRS
ncbi:bifunctional glutamate N-acetyltransferase/amino-acid acetyltransferase ArgJ, partial [Planktomarina temperata]|nr:bifunctional glutamate N-acetyltransferase/amino-acid acetyltransferase ArgJ [Planktomarina temperata]